VSGLFLRRSVVVVLLPHPDSRVIPLPNRTSPVRLRSPYGLPPTHPNLSLMKRPRVAGLNSNRVARLSDAAIQCRIPTAIHTSQYALAAVLPDCCWTSAQLMPSHATPEGAHAIVAASICFPSVKMVLPTLL
jgi:hypothetical protein